MKIIMRSSIFIFFLFYGIVSGGAYADEFSGTWKLEKSAEFYGDTKFIAHNAYNSVNILNDTLSLSPRCSVKLKKEKYYYNFPFQSLLKDGVSGEAFVKYMKNTFSFDMSKVHDYATAEESDCSKPFDIVMVSGDKLIVVYLNTVFYSYVRSNLDASISTPLGMVKVRQKLSSLPFDIPHYANFCDALVPRINGAPQTTNKCAPLYYPYVAYKKDPDPIVQLIGTHKYVKAAPGVRQDYDSPFSNGLHPLFVVLPPLKDVLLVRVDDRESSEDRDAYSGAYLTIRDGKVIDQLSEGCSITTGYACVDRDGKKQYQLLDTGKFKKL